MVHNIMVNNINVFGLASVHSAIENDYNRRKDVNFLLQNRFRLKASQFYFWYEFFFTWCILLIFQYVNIQYVENSFISVSIPVTSLAALLNITLIINSAFRFLYNLFSDYRIEWDYWTIFDLITSIVNMINILIITATVNPAVFGISPEKVNNYISGYNRSLKYFIAVVVSLNWVRTVVFFYCIRGTSSLLVTLVLMIKSTLNFLIILIGYLLIMTTIFYFIFMIIDKQTYPNTVDQNFTTFMMTFNYLFDAMVTNYSHPANYPESYDNLHRILLVIHVFLSSVLLLNYLVAILMIVFDFIMKEPVEREFNLRSSVYYFSRRFNAAMEDEYYGNLILIQPPLNLFNIFALPFLWCKETLKKVQYIIGIMYYFTICSGIIFLLFLYLSLISPIVTVKVFFLIFSTKSSKSMKLIKGTIFFFIGYFIILYHIFLDLYVVIIVLTKNYTLYNAKEETNTIQTQNMTLEIFKEMRKLLKMIYLKTLINQDKQAESILIQKQQVLDIVLKNKVDKLIHDKINKDNNTQIKLNIDVKISTKKSMGQNPKINLFQYFVNFKKKVKSSEVLKVYNQEIYDKIESLVNGLVMRDYRGEFLDLYLIKNIIFKKKVRYSNVEKILMINLPIMTSAIIDLQNKNNYGMIEYFDNLSKENYKKIKDKIDMIDILVKEIPSKPMDKEEPKNEDQQNNLENELIVLAENKKIV